MTRCLAERELYAAADGRLAARRRGHVAACARCAARIERFRAVRSALAEASAAAPAEWAALDARVMRAVRAASAPRRAATWSHAPVGLSFAAGVLVLLAVFLAQRPDRAPLPVPAAALAAAPLGERIPLDGVVLERFGAGSPARGEAVAQGAALGAAGDGLLRVALGDDIAVDDLGGGRLEVASLDEWLPTIRLDDGAYRVAVADGALAQELLVLAARAEMSLLAGTAEILVLGDSVRLRALGGPALIEVGGVRLELAAGEGLHRGGGAAAGALADGWSRLAAADGLELSDVIAPERPEMPGGTLPKAVVREVLRASRDRLRACYESALKRDPEIEVLPLTARLRVGASGRVARVELDGVERWPLLGQCLAGVLGAVRFPRPTGGEVDLVAPFRFVPVD